MKHHVAGDPGVVDQDIDAAEGFVDSGRGRAYGFRVRHVAGCGDRLHARCAQFLRNLFRLLLPNIHDGNACRVFTRKDPGCRSADAGTCPRNYSKFSA